MITKVSVRVRYGPRSGVMALLTVAVLVTAFLGYLVLRPKGAAAGAQAIEMQTAQSSYAPLRQYYLTSSYAYNGSQATSACAAGYHMASLWEILDPSNLRYNTSLGDSRADSGMGPPTVSFGWVRTGHNNDTGTTPGQANCNSWSSSSGAHSGTTVRLATDWSDATQQDMFVWDVGVRACSDTAPVWCVADEVDGVGTCSIPQPLVACGQQISGDTTGRASHIEDYGCVGWYESGPEVIYSLDLPTTFAPYTITAALSDLSVDLDVFLLSTDGCYTGNCAGVTSSPDGDTATATGVAGGTYYIAVDGYFGAAGSYTLSVDCGYRKVFAPLVLRDYP
jgi:hypothetical protein